MTSLTIFTVATVKYCIFLPPFIASNLYFNKGCKVEVLIDNKTFNKLSQDGFIDYLREKFYGKVLLRSDYDLKHPHSRRFYEEPQLKSDYVYISDTDIICLEQFSEIHLKEMSKTGLPFSNILRPHKKAMSGLHFSKWDAMYPTPELKTLKTPIQYDEALLKEIVYLKTNLLPEEDYFYRPVHGIHASLSRFRFHQQIQKKRKFAKAYVELNESKIWRNFSEFFNKEFKIIHWAILNFIDIHHGEELANKNLPTLGDCLK